MSSMGRKIARQAKQSTPEGKEEVKKEQEAKKAAVPQQRQSTTAMGGQSRNPIAQPRLRQRKAGGS